jgi:hypothetical protein
VQLRLQHLLFAAVIVGLVTMAYGVNYMYFSDCELTVFGDILCFGSGDTLDGPVRSNGELCIRHGAVFAAPVYFMGPPRQWGPGEEPVFLVPPVYNVDTLLMPFQAEELRHGAAIQGGYYSMPHKSYRVRLYGNAMDIDLWETGLPFDSVHRQTRSITGRMCLFFDGPLDIEGHLSGQLTIGSSHTIRLLDNVVYDDAVLTPEAGGRTPLTSHNILSIVSEGDIKIANTPANGRYDSQNRGLNQTNPDSTNIYITAALYALGESFTFEQQNDLDSGYVYQFPVGQNHRDDRGTIYLFGALIQHRRGYVHRATPLPANPASSTGYSKHYRWDPRLAYIDPPCAFEFDSNPFRSTDTLDFGAVPVGQTVWDTAHVYTGGACTLGSVIANTPFYATRVPPYYSDHFAIPTRFIPPRVGNFSGVLYISTPYRYFQIVLKGRGMPGGEPPHVDVSPNPFNLNTTLRYSLPEAGAVKITLYDVLGRVAKEMNLSAQEAGEHSAQINAEGMASGVYFIHLQTNQQQITKKVLLLK